MIESELGEIPKGWKLINLGSLFKLLRKKPKDVTSEQLSNYLPQI